METIAGPKRAAEEDKGQAVTRSPCQAARRLGDYLANLGELDVCLR